MKSTSILMIGKHENQYINRNAALLHLYAEKADLDVEWITFEELFSDAPKEFANDDLIVVFFFPHRFWDDNCELPQDTSLYGTSVRSYRLFLQYMVRVGQELYVKYPLKNLIFLIDPNKAAFDRDKVATIEILSKAGVPVTKSFPSRNIAEVLAYTAKDFALFIKCRYGSEGKGITYVSGEKWLTNYRVDGDTLNNYGIHDRWTFTDITGKEKLLSQLLSTEVIIEEEIVTPEIEPGTKFDLRVYVLDDEAPHMFLRVNRNESLVTNYSQGARVMHCYQDLLGQEQVALVKATALSAAKALNSRFVGVDCMFDKDWKIVVVETQVFTDFPDIKYFDLAKYLVDRFATHRLR